MDEAPREGLPVPLILVQFESDPEPVCAYWHSTMFGWVHDTGHGPFRIRHNPIGWLPLPDNHRPPMPIQKAAKRSQTVAQAASTPRAIIVRAKRPRRR